MKIQHEEPHKTISKTGRFARIAAIAAAALIHFSPLTENAARAQDRPEQSAGTTSQQGKEYSAVVSTGTSVLSLLNSERVLGEQTFPTSIADLRVSAIDEQGVGFTLTLDQPASRGGPTSAEFRVNFDGTTSGQSGILGPLGFSGFTVESAEGGQARLSFRYSEGPSGRHRRVSVGSEEPQILRRRHHDYEEYQDPVLSPFVDRVNINGRRRDITLDNNLDIGGNVVANEAGSAVFGSIRYSLPGGRTMHPLDLRFDGGNIWFGEQAAPFARLFVRPSIEFWRLKLAYYGSVATLGNMPSYIYTSHSIGFGYSQPLGPDARLRLGVVGGGALSYPSWDDIYFNIAAGASFEYKNFLAYAMPNFYFAASNPMETAYIGHYRPRFQDIELGVQMRFYEDQYAARLFGDVGMLNERVGLRLTRTINFSDSVSGDFYVAGGATHWIPELGGRWDPVAMLGMNIVIGGRHINSTNTFRYEHLQSGGVRFAKTDLPTAANPGPYGFGRSGDPDIDAQINQEKQRILESGTLQEFSRAYGGASLNQTIMAARFLGAFLQQVAYANNAYSALNSTRFFDPEVQRISNAQNDQIFHYIQRYVQFYSTHAPGDPLPEDLANGIAVCAGIHHVMAEFLRANGIPTIVASVNTTRGPHVVAIAQPPGSTALLDYGNLYETPEGTFDQAIRFYGQNRQAPTFQSQLFDGNGYMGTYVTSEGRLLHESIGIVNTQLLGSDFLGVR
jgi:hypothetical protein